MYIEKKHPIRLLLLTLALVVLLGSPVAAAVDGYVAESSSGELYFYSYDDLLDSYALKILGFSNGLYEDFSAKKTYALLSSTGRYVDYKDVLDCYASALLQNEQFDLNKYLSGSEAKIAVMPDNLNLVRLSSGQLVFSVKKLSGSSTQADPAAESTQSKTLIAGSAKVSLEQAQQWAANRKAHQRFVDIAPLYWEYGKKTGLRPEVLYAQAAVETDFGYYSSRVPPSYNNWAGIKIADADDDSVESHEVFSNPEEGVRAHYNHIAAYLGNQPVGEPHGRYFLVAGQSWAGTIKYVEELSGWWTPDPDYHRYILNLLDQINKTTTAVHDADHDPGPDKTETEVKPEPKPAADNGVTDQRQVAVNVGILHLRSGPGTNHEILERLHLGTILQVSGSEEEWLKVLAPDNKNGWVHGDYVCEINPATISDSPLAGKKIVVDPGHGGSDPGATGFTGSLEKELNLAVAYKLTALLEEAGAIVIMTRYGDQSMTNQQRVDLVNSSKADAYISIHANAYANPLSNGTETHYYPESSFNAASRYLAHQLQSELVSALNFRDRGVKQSSFYVLQRVTIPAALVEMVFLTNPQEEELLKSAEGQTKAATALYQGLKAYFTHYR